MLARDEYRSRVDNLEKENNDLTARIDELQNLADEARTLKDEVSYKNEILLIDFIELMRRNRFN